MRAVLIVAYYFPPAGGGGVARPLSWVRYLPEFGFAPRVLTCADPQGAPHDATRAPPADVPVLRVPEPALPHLLRRALTLSLPDSTSLWARAAADAARDFAADARIVVGTSPPPGALAAAARIARRRGLPWVADLRDPMVHDPPTFGTPLEVVKRPVRRFWERRLLRSAAAGVFVTAESAAESAARVPAAAARFAVVPNGYDEADFVGVTPAPRGPRVRLVHTGLLGGAADKRTIVPLLESLTRIGADDVEVRLVGRVAEDERSRLAPYAAAGRVTYTDLVPHGQALAQAMGADVNVVVNPIPRAEYGHLIVGGKVYEALRAGPPVFALSERGATTAVIDETGAGAWAAPDDRAALDAALLRLLGEVRAGRARGADEARRERYDRRRLARAFADVLTRVLDGPA